MKSKAVSTLMNRIVFLVGSLFLVLMGNPKSWAQNRIEGLGSNIPTRGIITLTGGAGIAYYMGDLIDGVDFGYLGLGPNLAIGGQYRLAEHFSLRGELRFYQLRADQKYSRNFKNNLSFRTRNPDLYVGAQAELLPFSQKSRVNPYLFAGIGTTYLNPKAKLDGTWHSLAPLQTEGVRYSRLPFLIAAGIGVNVRITDRWGAGLELCNNFLNSDYLDDVSTTYPQPDQLASDLARRLSDRSGAIVQPPRTPGNIRGNPKVKDSYVLLSVKANYILTTTYFTKMRRKTRCPDL